MWEKHCFFSFGELCVILNKSGDDNEKMDLFFDDMPFIGGMSKYKDRKTGN